LLNETQNGKYSWILQYLLAESHIAPNSSESNFKFELHSLLYTKTEDTLKVVQGPEKIDPMKKKTS
jgi:hypothetical protein